MLDPYSLLLAFTQVSAPPCFFFFCRRSRGSLLGVGLAVLSVCLSVCLHVHARPCFRTVGGVGRQDISHPIFDGNYGLFLGYGVRADVPCVCFFLWHTESASPPPTPFLQNAVKDSPGRGWGTHFDRQPYCHTLLGSSVRY